MYIIIIKLGKEELKKVEKEIFLKRDNLIKELENIQIYDIKKYESMFNELKLLCDRWNFVLDLESRGIKNVF